MNPARSLGPALMSGSQWVYIAGPLLGAVVGAYVYRWLREASQTAKKESSYESVREEEEKQ